MYNAQPKFADNGLQFAVMRVTGQNLMTGIDTLNTMAKNIRLCLSMCLLMALVN
jgi:hypothetical protein